MATAANNRRVGRLTRSRQLAIYWVAGTLLVTGLVWLCFFYFVRVVDQFGFENPHPLQGYLLIGHAVAALPAVWIYGFLWQIHIKPGWKANRQRWSGGAFWSLVLLMIVSGYALYYIGDDAVRDWVSVTHWLAGIPALVIFLVHIREKDRGPAITGAAAQD